MEPVMPRSLITTVVPSKLVIVPLPAGRRHAYAPVG
jgi:hypothetical protein